jgi:light-harvesting complex I chlorophyll a/b binding protein 1
MSKAFVLFGFAVVSGQRFYTAVQPMVQPAVQANVGLPYSRPAVVDTVPQTVLINTTPDTRSSSAFGVLAYSIPFGFLGYALARYGARSGPINMFGSSGAKKGAPAKRAPAKRAPVKKAPVKKAAPARLPARVGNTAITPGDIGTTKPLGVYDPLQLMSKFPDKYRRYQELEIKHGRFAMAACLHVFVTEAGLRWPGYLSLAEDIKFSDMPGGTIASWAAMPNLAWAQIVLIIALLDNSVAAQDPSKAPGDVGGPLWVRYEDKPGVGGKEFKLNAERNNGRAAMMGITGMIIHEGLTGNPLFPIPVGEQPILLDALDDIEKGPARVGSFVLAALGMVFCGAIASIPEFGKREAKA